MIRLSRMADYAVVLMTCLPENRGSSKSASDLACETRLPLPTVSRILKKLAQRDLLESTRGANGGYRLARLQCDITVVDIIAAVDGPIALTNCVEDGPGDCGIETFCPLRSHWQLINSAISHALRQVTLADLISPITTIPQMQADVSGMIERTGCA